MKSRPNDRFGFNLVLSSYLNGFLLRDVYSPQHTNMFVCIRLNENVRVTDHWSLVTNFQFSLFNFQFNKCLIPLSVVWRWCLPGCEPVPRRLPPASL